MKGFFLASVAVCALAYELTDFQLADPEQTECATAECLAAIANPSRSTITACREKSPASCEYDGVFTYSGDLLEDSVFTKWDHGMIVTGVPPMMRDSDLPGTYTTNAVQLHLNFEETEDVSGSDSEYSNRCIYMLSEVPAHDEPLPTLAPNQNCDEDGIPMQYMVTPTLQVGFLLANQTIATENSVPLRSLLMMSDVVTLLVEPLADYRLVSATMHGDLGFRLTAMTN